MIKEHELTKEIIESGVRTIRRRSIFDTVIIFNDKTELETGAIVHTLSVPRELKEVWKEKVYPYLTEFLDVWDGFRVTGIPYPQMAMQYDKEDDSYYYSIDLEEDRTVIARLKIVKESFKSLYIETSYPIDCLSPFAIPGDLIGGFYRYSINGRYLKFIATVSNNNLLKRLFQKYIEV